VHAALAAADCPALTLDGDLLAQPDGIHGPRGDDGQRVTPCARIGMAVPLPEGRPPAVSRMDMPTAASRTDLLDLIGTSPVSADRRVRMCSAAQIGRVLGRFGEISAGGASFWRQVLWREFSHHLVRNPRGRRPRRAHRMTQRPNPLSGH